MTIVEHYRERAAACERIAEAAISEDHRRKILQIARSWRELADEREQMLKQATKQKASRSGRL
jgi:tellurite resistance protein